MSSALTKQALCSKFLLPQAAECMMSLLLILQVLQTACSCQLCPDLQLTLFLWRVLLHSQWIVGYHSSYQWRNMGLLSHTTTLLLCQFHPAASSLATPSKLFQQTRLCHLCHDRMFWFVPSPTTWIPSQQQEEDGEGQLETAAAAAEIGKEPPWCSD